MTDRNGFKPRGYIGAHVRLYGFPGVYRIVGPSTTTAYDWIVVKCDEPDIRFAALDGSIVELQGRGASDLPSRDDRVPLRDLPISPPADDWPYPTTLVHIPAEYADLPLAASIRADKRFCCRTMKGGAT